MRWPSCEHCGQDIHFGPAAAALRDPHDLALSNDKVADLAWYHTSTFRDWPPPEYAALVGPQLRRLGDIIPPHIRDRQLAKALHVGTYESAIENMLRRMRDQDDAHSRFYLHRVSLNLAPTDINVGFRDENLEDASDLSLDELGGLRAVRYVNVHEASGSISLAIHPTAIDTIQTITLPPAALAPAPPAHVVEAVAHIEEELAAAVMPDTSGIDPMELRIRVLKARRSGDELALRVAECEKRRTRAWGELRQLLAEAYLVGVGPVVRDDFVRAMHAPAPRTVSSYHDHFAAHSAAFTRAEDVVAHIKRQSLRRMNRPR